MDRSSSTSRYAEKEDEISKSKSDPSTYGGSLVYYKDSVGYENVVTDDTITAYENTTANETTITSETATAYENPTAYEINTAYEGMSPYEGFISTSSSSHYFLPIPESWETENTSSHTEGSDQKSEDPQMLCKRNIAKLLDALNPDHEDTLANSDANGDNQEKDKFLGKKDENLNTDKLCKLIITLILDAIAGSDYEDSPATFDLQGEIQKLDQYQKEQIKQTISKLYDVSLKLKELLEDQKDDNDDAEDLLLSSSTSSNVYEVSHEENETYQDMQKWEAPEKEPSTQFLKVPPRLEEEELIEIISQISCTDEAPSMLVKQRTETDSPSEKETTCFQSFCKWLLCCPVGRRNPERATQPTNEQAPKKRSSLRSKRIHPQESLREDTL